MSAVDPSDVQAIIDRGFGTLPGSRFLLLRVEDACQARGWLRTLPITSLAEARESRQARVCQIAFTSAGLGALGLKLDEIPGFAPEFLDGMAGDVSRSRRLGDIGMNAPPRWRWGLGDKEPHILVMLLAGEEDIIAFNTETLAAMPAGVSALPGPEPSIGPIGREPFGFLDGVSQPEIDWDGRVRPGGAKDRLYRNRIALGEFLLGHANEYGFVTDYPEKDGLGLNGTYLVYRQLAQDVTGFWKWLADAASEAGAIPLAQAMVGRGIDGDPLDGIPAQALVGVTDPRNEFTFGHDADGIVCPIGAHIRRANPRSGDDPQGRRGFLRDLISSLGLTGTAMHDAVASARFHRILRRGRSYGDRVSPQEAIQGKCLTGETGLHFVCLNTNLARQFEFVQGAWVASPYFAGLSGEQDPLLGNRCPVAGLRDSDAFSYWDKDGTPRLLAKLPQFVTVVGGAYFLLPGLSGLAAILAD